MTEKTEIYSDDPTVRSQQRSEKARRIVGAPSSAASVQELAAMNAPPIPRAPAPDPSTQPNYDHLRYFNRQAMAAVVESSEAPILRPAELKALQELQAQYDRCAKLVQELSHQALRAEFKKQYTQLASQVQETGAFDPASRVRTQPDLAHEYDARRSAAKTAKRQCSAKAVELLKPVAARFANAARELGQALQTQEAELCQKFGIRHKPSEVVQCCFALADHIESHLPEHGGTAPMQLLPGIETWVS